ncbi:MAG: hypothetical protein NT039_01875 [Candidatus Berkelbacteria bacterium]|nr:hypothetical protein [Candidatus Berkelbacteria bacterium]
MPNRDDEQVLHRWREFLVERLGGIEKSYEELPENPWDLVSDEMRHRIETEPRFRELARVNPLLIPSMPDEEMCAVQGPIFELFGFMLSIPDHMVIMRELLPLIQLEASLLDVG